MPDQPACECPLHEFTHEPEDACRVIKLILDKLAPKVVQGMIRSAIPSRLMSIDDSSRVSPMFEQMPLRDQFACVVLPSAIDSHSRDVFVAYDWYTAGGDETRQEIAEIAYKMADAMLQARESKNGV